MTSPAFVVYLENRIKLIDEDRALRIDYDKTRSVSSAELRADRVVGAIRDREAKTLWGAEYDGVPHPFPGMEFLTGKKIILKSRLFEILRAMPKGALLHVHQHATVEAGFLLALALGQPAIHIRCSNVIDTSTVAQALPEIRAIPKEEYTQSCGITDAEYVPNTWVSLQTARETFDPALGGPEGFDKWIISTFVINPSEAYRSHNTPNKIWKKFQSTFVITDPIIRYLPVQKAYLREFIMSSIADGISYIESRYNFSTDYLIAEDAKTRIPIGELMLLVDSLVKEIQAELRQQGREDEFVGFKVSGGSRVYMDADHSTEQIIYTVSRTISCEQLDHEWMKCIEFKREFPHLIAGFDLVGQEDTNNPLIYYSESLLRFIEYQKQENIEVPFLFHAGETLGDGTVADLNLYDAILLGTKRIGHGFSLVKHPKLMAMCREQKIALEVCPISNEILRLTSSMATHPLPAMFTSMGLSFEFYQVLVASEVTGLLTLRQMARDSFMYSMLEQEEKEKALKAWERRWAVFLENLANKCDCYQNDNQLRELVPLGTLDSQIGTLQMTTMSSPALVAYLENRIKLIDEDRALRIDYEKTKRASSVELRADRVVRTVRDREAKTLWGAEHDGVPHPFPGMEFLTGKKIIMKSRLFEILRAMPKGALLHVHQYGTVDAGFLLAIALGQPAIHIRCSNVIDTSTTAETLPEIRAIPKEEYTQSCGITDAEYVPNTWVSLQTARETFDPALGGPEGFDKWIISTFVINPSEVWGSHNTPDKIWKKFQSTFTVSGPMIRYLPIQKAYLREFIMSSIADGISYIESRANLSIDYLIAEDAKTHVPIRELFLLIDNLIKEVKDELRQQGREDEFVGFKASRG
ncbi:hypothetical protein JVU11DRAFT_678 [Chiua virens]|nr:hypothetical protein JVU11DRAFT_678 [Chiua virens]